MKDAELLEALQNLDASLKMQAVTSNPNHAIVGPMITELAANRIETLLFEVARLQQEIDEMGKLEITQTEVQKLNMQQGEILIVKIRSDELTEASMTSLRNGFKALLPNNKVVVLGVGEEGSIDLTVAQPSEYPDTQQSQCGPGPASYCNDCSCGKKQAFERKQGE